MHTRYRVLLSSHRNEEDMRLPLASELYPYHAQFVPRLLVKLTHSFASSRYVPSLNDAEYQYVAAGRTPAVAK